MSTVHVTVGGEYVLLSGSEAYIQNISSFPVRIHVGVSPPVSDTEDFFTLEAKDDFVARPDIVTGDVFARSDEPPRASTITISAFDPQWILEIGLWDASGIWTTDGLWNAGG